MAERYLPAPAPASLPEAPPAEPAELGGVDVVGAAGAGAVVEDEEPELASSSFFAFFFTLAGLSLLAPALAFASTGVFDFVFGSARFSLLVTLPVLALPEAAGAVVSLFDFTAGSLSVLDDGWAKTLKETAARPLTRRGKSFIDPSPLKKVRRCVQAACREQ
jgi:hypothetical protein